MSDYSALKNDAKDQINGHEITCDPVAVLALITEVEALRKDAERYRWLRDTATGPWMRALDLYARRDKRMDVAIDEEINRMAKP